MFGLVKKKDIERIAEMERRLCELEKKYELLNLKVKSMDTRLVCLWNRVHK